jgi:hypothetical protein
MRNLVILALILLIAAPIIYILVKRNLSKVLPTPPKSPRESELSKLRATLVDDTAAIIELKRQIAEVDLELSRLRESESSVTVETK